ncbi:MAG: hypothetical protein HUU50_03100 [Candidatus Brocadiae bacterium]|nr:hypothetical protein [Candidatus Brocadiia bacterium]
MNYSLFYDVRLGACFYLWNMAHFFLTVLSLYFALVPFVIPNISLIGYGLSLVCLWQTIAKIFGKNLSLLAEKSEKKHKYSLLFLFHGFWLLYTGIVSAASNFFLFPHPYLHIFLSTCIYLIGFMLSCVLLAMGYSLWKGNISTKLQACLEKQRIRKTQIDSWIQNAAEKKEKGFPGLEKNAQTFHVKTSNYIITKIFSIALWLMIPVWVFILIPLRSYSSWQEISLFYQICMVGTAIWGFFWVGSFLLKSVGKYSITDQGIIVQNFCFTKKAFWHEIKLLQIEEDFIKIHRFHGKPLHILFQDLNDSEKFFTKLQDILPLSIFFIEPSGMKTIKKNMPKEFPDFEKKYQKLCDGVSDGLENNKNKKKKSSSAQ